jgi:hypothetical protein
VSKLNAAERKRIPESEFAGPGRSYPVEDKSHAANAKARATQMEEKGKLSSASAAKIKAKANRVLGEKKEGRSGGDYKRHWSQKKTGNKKRTVYKR